MTDETKKLFDAPWQIEGMIIRNKEENYVCSASPDNIDRIARLPELYDALVYFVHKSCSSANIDICLNRGSGWVGCRDCSLMPYIELLRKVRDGE